MRLRGKRGMIPESDTMEHHQIEYKPIEFFRLYERNPRKNDHVIEQMAEIIKRFGFRVPLLAKSNGDVADGHLRYKAARLLGLTELPYINCDDMTDNEVRAFRIAVNKAAELADWDLDLLKIEFDALTVEGFTIEDMGFEVGELDGLFPETTSFEHEAPDTGEREERESGEDETGKIGEQYLVLIECNSETHQQEVLENLMEEGYKCRALLS